MNGVDRRRATPLKYQETLDRFAHAVALLESSPLMNRRQVALQMGMSYPGLRDLLVRGGYDHKALLNERRAIEAEVRELWQVSFHEFRVEQREKRLAPCGTYAAYSRHRSRGEKPCLPCKDANAEYQRRLNQRLLDQYRPGRRRQSDEERAKRSATLRKFYRGDQGVA